MIFKIIQSLPPQFYYKHRKQKAAVNRLDKMFHVEILSVTQHRDLISLVLYDDLMYCEFAEMVADMIISSPDIWKYKTR